ncbi:MAG: hypothetical protein FWC55_07455, partial [Firmicutes bacterium]|nr:hypothetical protein [Bacillota bacterium]
MVCNAIIAVCGAAILILLLVILLGRENALSMVRGFVLEFMHKAQNEFAANQGMVKKAAVIGMIINSPFYAR